MPKKSKQAPPVGQLSPADRFNLIDENRIRLRELLNDPVMQDALDILRTTYEGVDVDSSAPEVASVRALSMRAGFEAFYIKLRALTVAPIPVNELGNPDWSEKQ